MSYRSAHVCPDSAPLANTLSGAALYFVPILLNHAGFQLTSLPSLELPTRLGPADPSSGTLAPLPAARVVPGERHQDT